MRSGPHLEPPLDRDQDPSALVEAPTDLPPLAKRRAEGPGDAVQVPDPGAAELARLRGELEELQERALLAEEAEKRNAARVRTAFADLTEAARAELRSIDAAHETALAGLAAQVRALTAGAGAGSAPPAELDEPLGGP
ncbi:MAG: hypothetical protein ACSLFP_15790 [Acidimicrobiales bacterium]